MPDVLTEIDISEFELSYILYPHLEISPSFHDDAAVSVLFERILCSRCQNSICTSYLTSTLLHRSAFIFTL